MKGLMVVSMIVVVVRLLVVICVVVSAEDVEKTGERKAYAGTEVKPAGGEKTHNQTGEVEYPGEEIQNDDGIVNNYGLELTSVYVNKYGERVDHPGREEENNDEEEVEYSGPERRNSGPEVHHYGPAGRKFSPEELKAPIGSDTWLFTHGADMDLFALTTQCMRKLRETEAKKHGLDPRTVHEWPIIDDHIYSLYNCQEDLRKLALNKQFYRRRKRKIYNALSYRWDNAIVPYVYHRDLPENTRNMIRAAMKHWQEETCVRFVPYHDEGDNKQYILYTNKADGCYSYIGKQPLKHYYPQQVNLESRACTSWIGIAIHEIGHALGLYHEQNRQDRGQFVQYFEQHVEKGHRQNFEKEFDTDYLGIPYDYGSIMQYDKKAFSNGYENGIVLKAKFPYSEFSMGQRGHLSFLDTKVINRAYCLNVCLSHQELPCEHKGYMDPNNCSQCRCPEGLGGRLCERAAPSHHECTPQESYLVATNELQCVSSPGYDTRGYYQIGVKCNWIIVAPPGSHIRARFSDAFGVYCNAANDRGPMCFHWVEIKHRSQKNSRGGRFCCYDGGTVRWNVPAPRDLPYQIYRKKSKLGVVTSDDNVMVVHFDGTWPQTANSETNIPHKEARRGFKLCFALSNDSLTEGQTSDVDDWFSRPVRSAAPPLLTNSWGIAVALLWMTSMIILVQIYMHFWIRF